MKLKIAFALIMGIITTGIVSFTLILINIGLSEKFLYIWLKSWLMGYAVVTPIILLLAPKVQLLVESLFAEKSFLQNKTK
jgi:hypothetical protein